MMNTYANGTCALQFPSSYILMDAEEMEYVDGGKYYGVNLSAKKCNQLAYDLTVIGGVLTVSSLACKGLALIPGFQAAVAGVACYGALATAAGLTSWFFTEAGRRGGCYVGYDSTKKKLVYGYGKY